MDWGIILPTVTSAMAATLISVVTGIFVRRDEAKKREQLEGKLIHLRSEVDNRLLVLKSDVDRSLKATEARVHVSRDIHRKILEQRLDDVREYRTKMMVALNEIHLFIQYASLTGPPAKQGERFNEQPLDRIERTLGAIAAVPASGPYVPEELIDKASLLVVDMQACFREVVRWCQMTDAGERAKACEAIEEKRGAIGRRSRALFDPWVTDLFSEHGAALVELETSTRPPPQQLTLPSSAMRILPADSSPATEIESARRRS